jgi:hypothetical protein
MSNATSVSDLERAEHLNYGDGKGVKRVSIFNDGDQVNVATEQTLQELLSASGGGASIPKIVTVGNYTYIGSSKVLDALTSDAVWQIIRLDTSSGLEGRYADATADYDKVFDNYASYTY